MEGQYVVVVAVAMFVAGAGTCYAILRNNIKGLKENEAGLIQQLKDEKAKRVAILERLIDKKNETQGG